MKADLEKELRSRTAWNSNAVSRLVDARPAVRVWYFAPGSTFDTEALAPLANARALTLLAFRDASLSPENLRALASVAALTRLDLRGCQFPNAGLITLCEGIAARPDSKLSELWLEDTAVGDDDLKAVGTLSRLRWLILSGTNVSDAGLLHLHGLKHLETLWLERTAVTDAGVLTLADLPRLTAVPTRVTACSPDLAETLFRTQMARQAPAKPADPKQVDAADARLQAFLRAMEAWERSAFQRSQEIEQQFRAQRPQPHVLSNAESEAHQVFYAEINRQKSAIAAEYCTDALQSHGAGRADSYGDPPRLVAQTTPWLVATTPSRTRTVFIGLNPPNTVYHGNRYTLKWEHDQWRIDTVHHWSGGWKSSLV